MKQGWSKEEHPKIVRARALPFGAHLDSFLPRSTRELRPCIQSFFLFMNIVWLWLQRHLLKSRGNSEGAGWTDEHNETLLVYIDRFTLWLSI